MDTTTGSHIKNSEKRKVKRNFRPKAASMFGLDGDAPYSLGNTMSTQKVPPAALKVGSGQLTGGNSSRQSSREEEKPYTMDAKMGNFNPSLKKELKDMNKH